MKKTIIAAMSVAAICASAPASALTPVDAGSLICASPFDFDVWGATHYSPTFEVLGQILEGTDEMFGNPALAVEVDNSTNTLFFTEGSGLFSADLVAQSPAVGRADVSTENDYSLDGIAIDDADGTLYLEYFDSVTSTLEIHTFDPAENDLDLYSSTTVNEIESPGDFAIYDGNFYIPDADDSTIVVIDVASGDVTGTIAGVPGSDGGHSLDATADGFLVYVYDPVGPNDVSATFYNITTDEWGSPVGEGQIEFDEYSCAWWGQLSAESPELADTGFDSTGLITGSAALVAVGSTIALRRRARR